MATRVPASQLYGITADDIRAGIEQVRAGNSPDRFADSSKFDLLVDAYRLPPKAVIALAAERSVGRILTPDEFSGGESSTAFRVLLGGGFDIVTKLLTLDSFDATFSVGRNTAGVFLLFESRGPERNIEYMDGLRAVLDSLVDLGAAVNSIRVESERTRAHTAAETTLRLDGYEYPVELRSVGAVLDLRRSITRAAAQTGRAPGATGGGNPTKRLRVELSFPEEPSLTDLASHLSGTIRDDGQEHRPFEFAPRRPSGRGGQTIRSEQAAGTVNLLHDEMQEDLYTTLVREHGIESVAAELRTAGGRPADLVVREADSVDIYEIKTHRAPRDCIREAMGQLLEYAYWPGSPNVRRLFVVGPTELDSGAASYLESLRETFGMPLDYLQVEARQTDS